MSRLLRRALVGAALVGGGLLVASAGSVLLLRFVDPPFTGIGTYRRLEALVSGRRGFRPERTWRDLEEMGTALPVAVIAAEDQRFAEHFGFDVVELRKALAKAERGGALRGASTLSQQTAKNLFLWPGRSVVRKALEAYLTVLIETVWPKRRILEVYLNVVEFGDGVYGGGAAARRFFGVPPSRLTARQAALLAAVLPNPHRYHAEAPSPYVRQRAEWILGQVRQLGGSAVLEEVDAAVDAAPQGSRR